ncbi:Gfo/Idh/MocA family protein [Paenibacillus thalictri]|uniref:Gfo/Idh/MocA family oxidoreductase n=1 Tax=Paenibacillus thalictri TaxID=2527873 RepID=A0A4Q9DII1_9BACL|nr:Gfo/Idh/MocA family oxidoreductase [Paenibacillus thalictri]TBL70920.1 Gfo/Idh/MocA family oxidoreductase [Paenibacillus thalictri]
MIQFAIVGCGHIAAKHVEAIQSVSGANLHTVCDTNRNNLLQFVELYGVPQWTTSFEDILNDPTVDVVSICTPSGTHAHLAIQAAQAGKHVVVEKPMALSLEDADAMIRACRKHHVKLTVVHPNRFRPAVMELQQAVKQGLFGKFSHINSTVRWNRGQGYYDTASWRGTKLMDGGVLMNQAIHSMDLLLWLMGPIHNVQAYTATMLRNIECEDVAVALLNFENGAVGLVEAATTIYPKNYEESISLFGETGSAVIGGPTANWIKHWTFEGMSKEDADSLIQRVNEDPFGIPGHQHIVADMVEAIVHDRPPVITGEDGRNALKLVLDIYQAAEHYKSTVV